jgi:light-regulated signal transduction histidine kinase (bacteriophytochrome)
VEDISLHLVDVAENGLAAGADHIELRIVEETGKDLMTIEIKDNGAGMDQQALKRALDPFYTTKPNKRVGLGLPLLNQAAREAAGGIDIQTAPGQGTLIRATFQLSHPDLKPFGDVLETLATLAYGHPNIRFSFVHLRDGTSICRWNSIESTKQTRTK